MPAKPTKSAKAAKATALAATKNTEPDETEEPVTKETQKRMYLYCCLYSILNKQVISMFSYPMHLTNVCVSAGKKTGGPPKKSASSASVSSAASGGGKKKKGEEDEESGPALKVTKDKDKRFKDEKNLKVGFGIEYLNVEKEV